MATTRERLDHFLLLCARKRDAHRRVEALRRQRKVDDMFAAIDDVNALRRESRDAFDVMIDEID